MLRKSPLNIRVIRDHEVVKLDRQRRKIGLAWLLSKKMADKTSKATMPESLAAIVECGYAIWADNHVDAALRARFDDQRIPVVGVRQVRVWGLQVDDERELPGLERTQMPDEEIWEVNLEAKNGSKYEVESKLLKAAPDQVP